jgi:OOP family OmpA-OmpF porin
MRLTSALIIAVTFTAAAMLSLVAAGLSVRLIEATSEIGVRRALDTNELTWAEVQADGLQITLSGIAPTEAIRFRALSVTGSVVDAARIIDETEVAAQAALAPPRFSAEVLRNDSGVSIIGLIPASTDRSAALDQFNRASGGVPVADFLETADYPAPQGWEDALAFALNAIAQLPRAKVSVDAGRVAITAIADSAVEKVEMEANLRRSAPPSLDLALDIAAPRPVIAPFSLRFKIDAEGAGFEGCSADTEAARDRIFATAQAAGMTGNARCLIGLGVPSPSWADAVAQGIQALDALGGGAVTYADADITLLALPGTDQALFDRVIGELETSLPDLFVLIAQLPEEDDPGAGPAEFTATLSPEGQVQLRGRVSDETLRELADSYAQARFGADNVYMAARIADGLPPDWTPRVLTGLEALATLSNGAVTVTADALSVSGNTGDPDVSTEIASLLSDRLPQGSAFDINVTYQEKLDPVASLPTPEECLTEIRAISDAVKIRFEPGSATIDTQTLGVMNDIAEVLKQCGEIPLEVQGHTDSQGREVMNLELSQSRADSILNELRARRVLTGSYIAKGYGETRPIADNGTEEGREANRRIEFHLIRPRATNIPEDSTLDGLAEAAADPITKEESPGDEQN